MAYKFITTKKRSELMKKIKSQKTKPERYLQQALKKARISFSLDNKELPGKPDIVLKRKKVAIFIDGEFWHGYRWKQKKLRIKANRKYWISKIERNIQRDKKNKRKLLKMGWTVIRFWQHQINRGVEACIMEIKKQTKK